MEEKMKKRLLGLSLAALNIFKLIDVLVGNRDARETEVEGLDIPQMGVPGYSRVQLNKASETPMSR
jgi:Amt family ammonium transporter